MLVLVFAELIATVFHWLSEAPVIFVRLSTVILEFTRYAVPISVLLIKAFSEVGIAIAARIKNEEESIPVFKSYQVGDSVPLTTIVKDIDIEEFEEVAEEVFTRYNTIKGFTHIDKDIPDIQVSIDKFINRINVDLYTTFEDIVANGSYKEAVAYFLALLETVRWGIVSAKQSEFDGEIIIEKNE